MVQSTKKKVVRRMTCNKRTTLASAHVSLSQFCTAVQNCCKATLLVNGTPRFLDHQKSETPEPIDIKLDRGDYVGDLTPHANFGISTLRGGGSAMVD